MIGWHAQLHQILHTSILVHQPLVHQPLIIIQEAAKAITELRKGALQCLRNLIVKICCSSGFDFRQLLHKFDAVLHYSVETQKHIPY